jgi:hypothetical protein
MDLTHKINKVKISAIRTNPNNPRLIKDEQFYKLVKSLKSFPQMLEIRPIVVNDENIVIGGNMRLKAAQHLNLKEVPIIKASDLTKEQQKEFIIKDNLAFGDWEYDTLANEYDLAELNDWGLEITFDEEKDEVEKEEKQEFFVPDCLYPANNIYDIPTLKMDMQGTFPELPVKPYGAESRQKGGVGTYHFYVDDYRFEAIWKDPTKVLQSGCTSLFEPNLSVFDTTPISYGLYLIYKKRWISRFFQESGIKVFADLNVAKKFQEYNVMGIPEGYNAFCTRGYSGRLHYLREEHEIAQKISGVKEPNFIIYGGGKEIKEYAAQNNLTYIQDFINTKDL